MYQFDVFVSFDHVNNSLFYSTAVETYMYLYLLHYINPII